MTQAYNLSQLANNLTSAGLLDAADGLVNAVPVANGGTGATTVSAARTNLGVAASAFSVPAGGIIMWSGSIASIPAGWFLCNGANGTPNLTDRFVVNAGGAYAVGASGGSANSIVPSHSHTASSGNQSANHIHNNTAVGDHVHNIQHVRDDVYNSGRYGVVGPTGNGTQSISNVIVGGGAHNHPMSENTTSHNHVITVSTVGVSVTNANLPPYYALAYIMKS